MFDKKKREDRRRRDDNSDLKCLLRDKFNTSVAIAIFKKMAQPQPLFHLFSVFSNKQHNSYKSMWKNVQMSIQNTALWFEPTTLFTWVVSHNH